MLTADVLIIGSEGAGALAAIELRRQGLNPMILTKGRIGKCGATVTAGADINVDSRTCKEFLGLNGDIRDSKEKFFEDTVIEGRYLPNQKIVEHHVEEIPAIVKDFMDWGMKIEKDLGQPAGHSYPRSVTTKGDEIMRVLSQKVKELKVPIYEQFMATDVLKKDGRVVGVAGLDLCSGEFVEVYGKAVIIATGGGMQLYPYSTAPDELTGDGHAMAMRAGVEFIDMEMVQFMGCTFMNPPAWAGISFPYCLGPDFGGLDIRMYNKFGHRFFEEKIDPVNKEHVTRDLLARGIMNEVFEGMGTPNGGVYYSLHHLPEELVDNFPIARNQPILSKDWVFMGFSFKELIERMKQGHAIEVAVASHFFCGGIRTDDICATRIPGLYAAGEVAGGTEGANRLSGNALTQVFVQGVLSGRNAAEYVKGIPTVEAADVAEIKKARDRVMAPFGRAGINVIEFKKEIQKNAWDNMCVVRTEDSLTKALAKIQEFKKLLPEVGCSCTAKSANREWVDVLQVESLISLAELIATSALARKETRGAHFRKDFPESDSKNYMKNIIVANENGEIKVSAAPIVVTSITPPEED